MIQACLERQWLHKQGKGMSEDIYSYNQVCHRNMCINVYVND